MTEICDVSAEDYPDLVAFLCGFENETRGEGFWRERFRLWWDGNPAFAAAPQRGWVLRDKGRITGFLGNIPSLFRVSGRDIVVHSCTTWRVLKEYRNQSLSLLLKQIEFSKDTLLFSSTTAWGLYRVFEAFHFGRIADGQSGRAKMVVLDTDNVARRRLGDRFYVRLLAKFAHPFLQTAQKLALSGGGSAAGARAVHVPCADLGFDELWARTKDVRATNVRSADVINWYCFGGERFRKNLFGCYESGMLRGYAVFGTVPWNGLKLFECLDVWLEPDRGYLIKSLMRAAKEFARDAPCDLMRIRCSGALWRKYLGGLLPARWSGVTYMKAAPALVRNLGAQGAYFYTQGDYGL